MQIKQLLDKPVFRLHLFGLVFTPKLLPTLLLSILVPLFIYLGIWQLRRYDYKQELITQFKSRQLTPKKEFHELTEKAQNLQFFSVKLEGMFDNYHQILVDNRVVEHRVGYDVITPFIAKNAKKIFLINRGFIPRTTERNTLPNITPVKGLQILHGMIKLPPKKIFVLSHQATTIQWPYVIQAIEIDKIAKALDKPVYPFIILLAANNPHGFIRRWNLNSIRPEKHIGYAMQWFLLALTLVIIYMIVNTSRGR